jgi:hypothetical protein
LPQLIEKRENNEKVKMMKADKDMSSSNKDMSSSNLIILKSFSIFFSVFPDHTASTKPHFGGEIY